jgi:hypothetical protein
MLALSILGNVFNLLLVEKIKRILYTSFTVVHPSPVLKKGVIEELGGKHL